MDGDGGIEEFKSKNHSLIELVSDEKKTKEYFDERYSELSEDEKKEVNALLLTIAHTIGAECNKKHSLFLSTTTDFEVAENLAKDIIFYCWLPKRNSPVSKTYIVVKGISEKLKKYGVVVEGQCYPNECEISLLYGIIPHFLIGILNTNNDEFWPNPAIQGIEENGGVLVNEKGESVWSHGLFINQSDFIGRIKKTKINKFAHLVCGYKYPDLNDVERTESERVPETKS
ncbi:MAG: hypothetical protein MR717_07475 [Prevotella sp.]|nr:hypothetical protein [Prevotella sp.]